MKKHTVVVLDPELKITCGGIILPLNRILIPHECWQNKVRKYTAIIQHRFLKSGVRTYFLKAIIGTTGLSLDINAVEVSSNAEYCTKEKIILFERNRYFSFFLFSKYPLIMIQFFPPNRGIESTYSS